MMCEDLRRLRTLNQGLDRYPLAVAAQEKFLAHGDLAKQFNFMKLILKASEIPIESTVTKVGGTKKYLIKDVIKILGQQPHEIRTDKSSRLLFPTEMSYMIDSVSGDTELVWHVEPQELYHFIYATQIH